MLGLVKEFDNEFAEKFQRQPSGDEIAEWYRHHYLKQGTKYKTFIATVDDKIVGYVIASPRLGMPEIDMLDVLNISSDWIPPELYIEITFVLDNFRNKGISKKLKNTLINYAKEHGHKEIWSYVAKWNEYSISANRSLGFQEEDLGERYRFYLRL